MNLNLITTKGLKYYQIALGMIVGLHIAAGAIASEHISAGAINDSAMIANGTIVYDNLDANLKAKIDHELPYAEANRVPTADDDSVGTADQTGVTWHAGTVASRRAKWLYKPDGAPESDWEVYECVKADSGAAVWILSTLTVEDLSDLAFKTQAQLEQDITITASRVSDFTTEVQAVIDNGNYAEKLVANTFTEKNTFDGGINASVAGEQVLDTYTAGGGFIKGFSIGNANVNLAFAGAELRFNNSAFFNAGFTLNDSNPSNNSPQAFTGYTNDLTEAAGANDIPSAQSVVNYVGANVMKTETVTQSTVGATSITYTASGSVEMVFIERNGGGFKEYTTLDVANKTYNFAGYPVQDADDAVTLLIFYK